MNIERIIYMWISEAADKSGLKIDTIRYYDDAGLIPKLTRSANGNRDFSPENVEWLTLLYWLRETGMPMSVMRGFAGLYAKGDKTIPESKRILLDHSQRLGARRIDLDRCEEILAKKIEIYEGFET